VTCQSYSSSYVVDCGVVEVGNRVVRSNSPALSKFATSILPPPLLENSTKLPLKNKAATPSPGHSSPRHSVHLLIVVSLSLATRLCGLIRPPGCKLRPLSYLPPPPCQKNRPKSPYKNEVAKLSPGRFSPRPQVRSLIVVWLRYGIGWCGQTRPPGCK
jgi:hypothetical protein